MGTIAFKPHRPDRYVPNTKSNNCLIRLKIGKTWKECTHWSAMVTSTSTPGSMVMEVICFTTSAELKRSITRLWTRSSNLSHVLVPTIKNEWINDFNKNWDAFEVVITNTRIKHFDELSHWIHIYKNKKMPPSFQN